MKKRRHTDAYSHKGLGTKNHIPTYLNTNHTLKPLHLIKWVLIPALCLVALVLAGGISLAQTSNVSPLWAQKQQVLQRQIDTGRAHAQPKVGFAKQAPAIQSAPVRQTAISNIGQGPFSSAIFTLNNSWQGPVGKDWVFAYAGAKTLPDGHPGVGSIMLYTQTVNAFGGLDFHPLGTFAASNGTATLTIVSVNGTLLKVRSATGQELIFNLQTHQFQ